MADEKEQSKNRFNLPEEEEKILEFWEREQIFEKTLTKKGKTFVFYEGPPTANGRPGIHHVEARAFKDIVLRYKTMAGFVVPRKAGWDTHGLPVEIEVEKELGIRNKSEIEKYGIAKFNKKARESVWRYKDVWEKATKRWAFWIDLEHPYITYETKYIETLWWIIKEFWKKGFLYQDFRSVPWCPRCGTGLSSHELGLGYKRVKDRSVYVKLALKNRRNEFLLVWTTTPWTLPANVAVALNSKMEYTKYRVDGEFIWSAKTPPFGKEKKISIAEKISGNKLAGLEYEPVFNVPEKYSLGVEPPYKIFAADFVGGDEGTGMVHIAPAFGEEDLTLMKNAYKKYFSKDKIYYPIIQTVDAEGKMKKGVVGEGKFVKDADALVVEELKKKRFFYGEEEYEHDYPFCWRCLTPLLYYARAAWWVKTTAVKKELLENNERINWVPEHIKQGRFGEFLREVRDWAFSRERFWGTPLPIWKCEKCGEVEVVASREELARKIGGSANRYFVMRHGEAVNNVKNIISSAKDGKYHLTPKGRKEVEAAAKNLKNKKIDAIYTSPVLRTRETAELTAKLLGVKEIHSDERLSEIDTGIFEGKSPSEYNRFFSSYADKFAKRPPEGETLSEARARALDFLQDVEKTTQGKNILVVSHDEVLWLLCAGARGLTDEEALNLCLEDINEEIFKYAEVKELKIRNLPADETGEVNLHRPYVDAVSFACAKCKSKMVRVPEVADVWFDSGSMPYAQIHYPFSKEKLEFPADYICEAIDQTRGWFYTLLAVSTLLGRGAPFKNVISLGHVLDKNGQKMSKSKGNVVDPQAMIEKYGTDALRWYFYTVNQPGEPKRFDENDLQIKLRSFLMTFWNSFLLFDTYVEDARPSAGGGKNKNILDRWIIAKLNRLTGEVTRRLDNYDITGAARLIEEFTIEDFSQWYLRRSRRRLQRPESAKEKEEAAEVIARVLLALAGISAPFIPFLSEIIYQKLRKKTGSKEQSVHLRAWPKADKTGLAEEKIIQDMETVRAVVASALKIRANAGIKVRQPLASLQIRNPKSEIRKELLELIKEEVNVKNITFGREMKLDSEITSELKEEGIVREFVRNIQEMRRDLGLTPKNVIRFQVSGSKILESIISRWEDTIKKETSAKEVKIGGKKLFAAERELNFEGEELWLGIDKI